MKLSLLLPLFFIAISLQAQNSDSLLYERFETGGAAFNLNTPDESGVSAAVGYNQWIINDEYTGGNGQLVCSGFPTTFTVPNTPLQPAGITGGTTTKYMHIISDAGQSSGILNCSYLAANGLCGNDEYNFSTMAQDVNTSAYDSVTVSFLWLCEGAASIYGELYYSIDSGTSWNVVSTPSAQFSNQSTWTNRTITIPAFAGQTTLRFGFRFVNEVSFSAGDPGFAIDEFLITATNAVPPLPPPVAAFSVSDSAICVNNCVDFTDMSINSPTSWFWVFQGSMTSFSTQTNPSSICYNTPGTYDVTLIVQNASGTDTITVTTITVFAIPASPVITASGDTLFATQGFATYEWYLDGLLISGASGDSYITTSNGSYAVTVTDSNGCSSSSVPFVLNTGLYEMMSMQLNLFPNPTTGNLFVETGVAPYYLTVYNIQGQGVYQLQGDASVGKTIDLTNLAPGCYSIKLISENGEMRIGKFLKQ